MVDRDIGEILKVLEDKAQREEITLETYGSRILVAPPFGVVMAPNSSEFREFSDNLRSLGVKASIYTASFLLREALKAMKGELQPPVPFGQAYMVMGRRPNSPNPINPFF